VESLGPWALDQKSIEWIDQVRCLMLESSHGTNKSRVDRAFLKLNQPTFHNTLIAKQWTHTQTGLLLCGSHKAGLHDHKQHTYMQTYKHVCAWICI